MSPFLKQSLKYLAAIVGVIVAMRYTQGAAGLLIALVGIWAAFSRRTGTALIAFCLMPCILIVNPGILPNKGMFGLSVRIATPLMALLMLLSASTRSGRHELPIHVLWLYLVCAVISSMSGYFPMISYFKIVNFSCFLLSIYVGTKNMHHHPEELMKLRAFFMAFCIFVIWGSALTLLHPPTAYYLATRQIALIEGEEAVQSILAQRAAEGGMSLLCGVTNQSQCLAPLLGCCVGWLACDMLFIEGRMTKLHGLLLASVPFLVYKTRSRIGLVVCGIVGLMVVLFCLPRLRLPARLKGKLRGAVLCCAVLVLMLAGVAEVRNHTMSAWLRKVDANSLSVDSRGLGEAVTASRRGLIDSSMQDFKKNPFWGMGFQTCALHPILYKMGLISLFSAPIEKGVVFTMILGEGGILGFAVFLAFLGVFYATCLKKHYYATVTMFTVFLGTNLAEGTFFSPGGAGGTYWIVCVVGGFATDILSIAFKIRQQQDLERMYRMMNAPRVGHENRLA